MDFSRYAPERPGIYITHEEDGVVQDKPLILLALSLLIQAIRAFFVEKTLNIRIKFYIFRHSLFWSWAFAAWGWGVSIGLFAYVIYLSA